MLSEEGDFHEIILLTALASLQSLVMRISLILSLLLVASCAAPPSSTPVVAPPEVVEVAAPVVPVSIVKPTLSDALKTWCARTEADFKKYNWGASRCDEFNWSHVRNSVDGHPIPWMVFGDETNLENKNVTLIMCGVHGDEITPIKFCYDIMYDLKDFHWDFTERVVVVAPLVSPDSFFKAKPTRTNARGVDVNRNFPTQDWTADALRLWKAKHGKDKRRFPGHKALSEPEVVFQVNLIKRYKPAKIISVHSPLMMLDYDGPDLKKDTTRPAKDLLLSMSEKASSYKVSNYPHFPGSLGNWAGQELGIPTYTLELPNSDPHQSDKYWKLFREAIHHAIEQRVGPTPPEAPVSAAPSPSSAAP
jgi:murein peptide amidase A